MSTLVSRFDDIVASTEVLCSGLEGGKLVKFVMSFDSHGHMGMRSYREHVYCFFILFLSLSQNLLSLWTNRLTWGTDYWQRATSCVLSGWEISDNLCASY